MRTSHCRPVFPLLCAAVTAGLALGCGDPDLASDVDRGALAVSQACPALLGPIQTGLTRAYEGANPFDGTTSTTIAVVTSVQSAPEKVVFTEEHHREGGDAAARPQARSLWRCEGGAAFIDHVAYSSPDGTEQQRVVHGPVLPADVDVGDTWELKFVDTDADGTARTSVWNHWVSSAEEEDTAFGLRRVVLIVAGGAGGVPGGATRWAEGLGRLHTWLIQDASLVDLRVDAP